MRPPTGSNAEQVNTNPKTLSDLDASAHVLIARKRYRIAHCMVSSQLYHARNDKGVHTLLLALASYETETEFDMIQES